MSRIPLALEADAELAALLAAYSHILTALRACLARQSHRPVLYGDIVAGMARAAAEADAKRLGEPMAATAINMDLLRTFSRGQS